MDKETARRLIRQAYLTSTKYMDSNLRKEWEENERQFQGRHPLGSKYETDAYKYRSKLVRPKTRATMQTNEADCSFAFFSTDKLLDVRASDDANPIQRASAAVMQQLCQWRLTQSVPWYDIVVGGYQEANKANIVIAYLYWCYKSKRTVQKATVMTYLGEEEERAFESFDVVEDRPVIELVPPENFRISPASGWTDPVNTSPYLIHVFPMTVGDVEERMRQIDQKTGEPKWRKLSRDEISAESRSTVDTTKMERNYDRQEPESTKNDANDFDIVYVHRNFLRHEGEDWVWYTLGPEEPLTDPVPASELYWHLRPGERPYVFGTAAIEAHKTYPQGGVCSITRDLQRETNDLTNLRMDNLKQAILGIYGVKRTANVDYDALRSQIPGSGVLMDSQEDVWPIDKKDVTASSYQEQTRMDADFGDISGAFAPSNVMTNRQMGDTVGGMQLLSAAATKVGDYRIQTYARKFIVPVLGQFVRLIQAYETDEAAIALAGQRAKVFQKYGIDQITDEMLRQEQTVTVNVGIGSTDPVQKVQRLLLGVQAIGNIVSVDPMNQILDLTELGPEVFGAMGYSDGMRFFKFAETGEDPRIPALMQQIQQLQQAIQTKQIEEQGRDQRMQLLQDKKSQQALIQEQMKGEYGLAQTELKARADMTQTGMKAHADMAGRIVDGRMRAGMGDAGGNG